MKKTLFTLFTSSILISTSFSANHLTHPITTPQMCTTSINAHTGGSYKGLSDLAGLRTIAIQELSAEAASTAPTKFSLERLREISHCNTFELTGGEIIKLLNNEKQR